MLAPLGAPSDLRENFLSVDQEDHLASSSELSMMFPLAWWSWKKLWRHMETNGWI